MDSRDTLSKQSLFRHYNDLNSPVTATYQLMHQNQTDASVKAIRTCFTSKNTLFSPVSLPMRKRLMDLFPVLDKIIDESDPDTALPQIYHAYQTAEALKLYCDTHDTTRLKNNILIAELFGEEWQTMSAEVKKIYPTYLHELYPEINDWSWLPLVGFLHDMGKVLASEQWGKLPQWQVVGDTFPMNAPFATANIFYEQGFYKSNATLLTKSNSPDYFGDYEKHCGLNNVLMSFGHDEYMFLILNNAIHHLPSHALYMIRFHSFYAWHTPRNGERGYTELASQQDWQLLPLLKLLQRSDLYSKKATLPNIKELQQQYIDLINKFVPGRINTSYNLRPAKIKMSELENEIMQITRKSL